MFETKTITDASGDKSTVSISSREVDLRCREGSADTLMCFTPKQARKLAKALKRAAKSIEVEQGRVA